MSMVFSQSSVSRDTADAVAAQVCGAVTRDESVDEVRRQVRSRAHAEFGEGPGYHERQEDAQDDADETKEVNEVMQSTILLIDSAIEIPGLVKTSVNGSICTIFFRILQYI